MKLKHILDDIYANYHHPRYLGLDPLIVVRRYKIRDELETVGLLAAALAYGRVEIIVRNIDVILNDVMGNDPIGFIKNTSYKEKLKSLQKFKHRFNDGQDISALLEAVNAVMRDYGTLEKCFSECMKENGNRFKDALTSFTGIVKKYGRVHCGDRASFEYLIPSPGGGSACKRMVLYLRWMARKDDGIDLGVWKSVPTSCLIIPVDTHIAKISRKYELTARKSADWKMAEEITNALRKFDSEDPVKYDFALSHAGMTDFRT